MDNVLPQYPTVKATRGAGHKSARPEVLGDPAELLTREDVAALLKVKPRQVQRLRIPSYDLGPKTPRYRRDDVLAWLDSRRRPAGRAA